MRDLVIYPLLLSMWVPCFIVICYVNGLLNGHFSPILPLVSDTGNYMPEAAMFSISLSVIGILFLIVGGIRDVHLVGVIDCEHFPLILNREGFSRKSQEEIDKARENIRSLIHFSNVSCVIICLSCCMTGAFRMAEAVIPHFSVAFGIFTMTPIYMSLQTYLTYLTMPVVSTKRIFRIRLWLSVFSWFTVAIFLIAGFVSTYQYGLEVFDPVNRLFWNSDQTGYYGHVICCLAEWGLLLSVSPFTFTYCFEFRRFVIRKIQCEYYFHNA